MKLQEKLEEEAINILLLPHPYYKQYTNSIRDLIVLPLFCFFVFILRVDLTIGLIHVIAQQIQKNSSVHRCWAKSVTN